MNREQAERVTWKILGEIEESMDQAGVAIHTSDSGDRLKVRAFFEDPEYGALENKIVGILQEADKVQPVLQAELLDGHDS